MAIIIEKASKCPICGNILDNSSEYIVVPPLTSNTKDSLFIFSDSGIHNSCLNVSSLKCKLLKHIDFYNRHLPTIKLKCHVDGKLIDNLSEILHFGLLTSDETEELYDFNYLSFNLKNVNKWIDSNRFLTISENFLSKKKWGSLNDFNKLKYIVDQINSCR